MSSTAGWIGQPSEGVVERVGLTGFFNSGACTPGRMIYVNILPENRALKHDQAFRAGFLVYY
jgi:hypothetical protein